MAITVGGSSGVTFPDSSNTPASGVTTRLGPAITDTANVMTIQGGVVFDGTNGIYANGNLYSVAMVNISYTFSASTANASLDVTTISGYVAGASNITITVNSGVYLYSTAIGTPGLTLTGGTTGDTITLVNNGYIMGKGGNGGTYSGGTSAQNGGTAISLGFNTTINNTNASAYIGGGGGGGGGSGTSSKYQGGGGGAGGGNGAAFFDTPTSGSITGAGGTGGSIGSSGNNGNYGTYTSGKSVVRYGTSGGGGRIFAGTGGLGADTSLSRAGQGGGAGGGGGGYGQNTTPSSRAIGGNGGAGSASGGNGSFVSIDTYNGGGGGGWGASGGVASFPTGTGTAGTGGKAVALNGKTVTWVSGNTTRVYGAVA